MAVLSEAEIPGFPGLSLLALVQGLTEFLPISSSGHLVLTQVALGMEGPAVALDVMLHLGTLIAVVVVYRGELLRLARGLAGGASRDLLLLLVGSLPAALVGIGLRATLDELFAAPRVAGLGLLVTAAILLAGEAGRRRQDPGAEDRPLRVSDALWIGLAQAFAIVPGVSRSGATIAMGLLLGQRPAAAARFSFLLSIPVILGAALLELPDLVGEGGTDGVAAALLLWATLLAAFVGWGALRVLLGFLGRGAFSWFAAYCVVLGGGFLLLG